MSELKNHTFTGAGTLPAPKFKTNGRFSEIVLGEDGVAFPTSIKILKLNQKGTYSLLREFTERPTNSNILIETTPGSTIDIEVDAACYVEINNLVADQ